MIEVRFYPRRLMWALRLASGARSADDFAVAVSSWLKSGWRPWEVGA